MSPAIRIYLTFSRSFRPSALVISLVSASLFWYHCGGIWYPLLWFKLITMGLILYFADHLKHSEYPYYANLGYSKTRLWTVVKIADLLIFILLLILASHLPPVSTI